MIEKLIAELIQALDANTIELRNQRTGTIINSVSDKSLIVDKTNEQREAESYALAAEQAGVGAEEIEELKPEDITIEGEPEALVDKAGPAYQEMKDAILALARVPDGGKDKATAVLAEFGIDKMFNAKNGQVPGIVKRAREELAKATAA